MSAETTVESHTTKDWRKLLILWKVGMHAIGFFANIQYADILQFIGTIIDTDTNI